MQSPSDDPAHAVPEPGADALLLERVVARHRASAAILRAGGRELEARRAERFASRIRVMLDDPATARRMHALIGALHESAGVEALLDRTLEGAIALTGGDFGNVQLRHPTRDTLRIAAQSGFSAEFLEYFAAVDDDSSACGRAAMDRARTVIVDVRDDPAFARHRDIAAAAGFRAVQSTPVIDPSGRLRGVVSTHFRRPHLPSSRDLELTQWLAEHLGAALARRWSAAGGPAALTSARLHRLDPPP